MWHWPTQVFRREVILLLLCAFSDLLPRTLISDFLLSHGALWRAVIDNVSHACIAAASWAVVVSLSPPTVAVVNLHWIALLGSPLHRCMSSTLRRRILWHRQTSPPPPPPPLMPSPPPQPNSGKSTSLATTAPSRLPRRQPPPLTPPLPAPPPEAVARRGTVETPGTPASSAAAAAEIVLAVCAGSLLDLDHFLAARSLRLSRATGLAGRPWGHCVAALLVAALVLVALTQSTRAAACVVEAGLSHQLRDATRRGLWLYPPRGPQTPPLGYPAYLLAQALLPLLVALCLRWRGGIVSRCGRSVRSRVSKRRGRWPCARGRSRGEGQDRDSFALLPL